MQIVKMPSRMKIHLGQISSERSSEEEEEDLPPPFFALNAVHIANAVCEETADTRTQDPEGEEHGEAQGSLFAGVVLCDQQSGTWCC
jgi:hypothetical protein